MIHLREIQFNHKNIQPSQFPLNLPALVDLSKISFSAGVTIFVGENGSGKSTLLEALACKAEMVSIGSDDIDKDGSLDAVRPLADRMSLIWNKKTHKGFFLRAEDFFGYIKRLRIEKRFLENEVERIDQDFKVRSDYAGSLAKTPIVSSLHAMQARYGIDLGAQSHGESFLALFQSRYVPNGLYLLDEPEAALSPISQLGLVSLIKAMIEKNGQFIIATHSPILMAIPGAILLDFDQTPPAKAEYDHLEHVQLYRSFLDDPGAFMDKV